MEKLMLMHLNCHVWLTVDYEQFPISLRGSKASELREWTARANHASAPTKTAFRRVSSEFPRVRIAHSSPETVATQTTPVREQGYSFLSSELHFF